MSRAKQFGTIEAGWTLFREMTLPLDTPAAAVEELRFAFIAGAQYLFTAMASLAGDEMTETSTRSIDRLYDECNDIDAELQLRYLPARGSA
jgi:hypothetical protein